MKRAIFKKILSDLEKHIVLLHGPRQTGKTWIADRILEKFPDGLYLNYDNPDHRRIIENMEWYSEVPLLIFDEIHRMKDWSIFIKGVWDAQKTTTKILVTGSSNLEARRSNDESIAGRYRPHHLFPFSIDELPEGTSPLSLFKKGGFPEPYLEEDEDETNRWRSFYFESLLTTDIKKEHYKITKFQDIPLLAENLRNKVGSPLSIENIAGDLKISPITVRKYLDILEVMNVIFRVYPHHTNIHRSIEKKPKVYFYDIGYIEDEGARYENFLGLELKNAITRRNDFKGTRLELRYLRTRDGQEVDFVITDRNKPLAMYEAKLTKSQPDTGIKHFSRNYSIPAAQVLLSPHAEIQREGIDIIGIKTAGKKWLPH